MCCAYLTVSAALTFAGLAAAWAWREQRGVIVLSGALLTPFALFEEWFEPDYWRPDHVFAFSPTVKTGLEDLLFCFGCGSLIWTSAAWLGRDRLRRNPRLSSRLAWSAVLDYRTWGPRYLISAAVGVGGTALCRALGLDIMTAALIGFGVPGAGLLGARCDFAALAIRGALGFALLHASGAAIAYRLWPEFSGQWTAGYPWDRRLLGIPCGEWAWAIGIGAIWPAAVAFWLEKTPENGGS